MNKKKVFIVYASAGHGHKKIAEALYQDFIEMPHFDADVRLIDILDYTNPFFKKVYPGVYYLLVRFMPALWGFCFELLNSKAVLALINPIRRFFNKLQIKKLVDMVIAEKPDWIVNTHYLFPGVIGGLIEKKVIETRMITIVTDFKVHGFWINPGQELYVGMCDVTRKELLRWDVPSDKIELWGIPVHPKFRKHQGRQLLMKEFGLDESRRTVLITSGSFGLSSLPGLLEVFEKLPDMVQMIFVTGSNRKLFDALQKKKFNYPVQILGYVNNMDQLMEVSDIAFIKPGGSTVCELLVKACPFFMMQPIPGQEEGNGEVLILEGISHYISKAQDIVDKWSLLANPETARKLRVSMLNFAKPEAGLRVVEFIQAQLRP